MIADEYLRYSVPTAKLTAFLAHSDSGVSPLIVPRACDSFTFVVTDELPRRKLAISGVMLPAGPKMFTGTQPLLGSWQTTLPVASVVVSRPCWKRLVSA